MKVERTLFVTTPTKKCESASHLISGNLLYKVMNINLNFFDNTGDAVWAVDKHQCIIYWNNASQQLFGYQKEAAVGRLCYKIFAGRDLGDQLICQTRCNIYEYARLNQPIKSFDARVINREGDSLLINFSSIIVPSKSDGEFEALIHLARLIDKVATPVPPLKIRLLGPVMVQRYDGSIVAEDFQKRAKVRALFSLLALHRSQGVRRDKLLAMFWPNIDRHAGLHNLNTTIYYLRRSLEPGLKHGPDSLYIQNRGERYLLLGISRHWLDVELFETKLTAAHRETDNQLREKLYRAAIALYRGDYMADLDAYELDCWAERERYRQLFLDGVRDLGDTLKEQGKEAQSIEMYRKVLAEDPCREDVARRLMRLALERDETTKALLQYARLRKDLERRLKIKPSEKTRQLQEKARSQD
jgi:PAS domain S-box-containing protein